MILINKEKLIPKIRFYRFITDWEQRKFYEIGTLNRGKSKHRPRNDERLYNGEFPFIQTGDVAKAGLFLIKYSQTYNDFGIQQSKFWDKGTLLITIAGNIAETSILGIKAAFPDSIIGFNSNKVDMVFIKNIVDNASNTLKRRAETSFQANLNLAKLSDLDILLPTLEEQIKIGNFFKQLDNTMILQQQLLNYYKQLKKVMLQKMLPQEGEIVPKMRFIEFTDNWEQYKLKKIGKTTSSSAIESEFVDDGKYKIISIGSYSEQSTYIDQGIRANKTNKTESQFLKKDDLAMLLNDKAVSGRIIGRVLLIEKDDLYIYNQRTERIEPNQEEFNSQFLYQLLNAPLTRLKIIKQAQGNTQIYVNFSAIRELEYLIPKKIEEQIKIGNFLKKLDENINLHQKKLETYQELKKAMLQKMYI